MPGYIESSGVIEVTSPSESENGTHPEMPQRHPELFTADSWDISGMGFYLSAPEYELELHFADGFHLLRGITLLGMND